MASGNKRVRTDDEVSSENNSSGDMPRRSKRVKLYGQQVASNPLVDSIATQSKANQKKKMNLQMETLGDNELLQIFSYLNIESLYSVAKCSHRFEKLAIDTFAKERMGDYRSIGDATNQSAQKSADMLRIFGPSIRKFKAKNFPKQLFSVSTFWKRLDIAALKQISISHVAMQSFVDGWQTGQYGNFQRLKKLTIGHQGELNFRVKLREMCPKLTTLQIGTVKIDNDLKRVSLDAVGIEADSYIKLMLALGLHETLEELSLGYHSDVNSDWDDNLSKFTAMKEICIDIYGTGDIMGLTDVFEAMHCIESVAIGTHARRTQEEWEDFLHYLAYGMPNDVKYFSFDGPYLHRIIWSRFLQYMPGDCECNIPDYLLI